MSRSVPPWNRALGHQLFAVAAVLLCTVWITRPLVFSGGWGLLQTDAQFTHLATEHLQDVLLRGADWREAPLGWPLAHGSAHADWSVWLALVGLPFRWAGLDPAAATAWSAFLGLALSGFALHLLAQAIWGRGPHTALAGVLLISAPASLVHLQHLNLVHHGPVWVATTLLAWALWQDRPWVAGLAGAALVGCAHAGAYLGLHAAFAGVVVVVALMGSGRTGVRTWGAAAGGALAAGATVVPVALFYLGAAQSLGLARPQGDLGAESWDPSTLFAAAPPGAAQLHTPGWMLLALALPGAWVAWTRLPRRWTVALATGILAAIALSVGPALVWQGSTTHIPGPMALLEWVPGLSQLRGPERWWAVASAGLAVLGAGVVAAIGQRAGTLAAAGSALLLGTLASAQAPAPPLVSLDQVVPHPVYREISALAWPGPFADLGLWGPHDCGCNAGTTLRMSTLLGQPAVLPAYARMSTALGQHTRTMSTWPSTEAVQLAQSSGLAAVVLHPPLAPPAPEGWSCRMVGDHGLCTPRQAPTPPATRAAPVAKPPRLQHVAIWAKAHGPDLPPGAHSNAHPGGASPPAAPNPPPATAPMPTAPKKVRPGR